VIYYTGEPDMKADRRVEVLDATLREGEQQSGVRFSAQDKIAILHLLEDFGVRFIEGGHPGISEQDERICREVVHAARYATVLMHSRANVAEVQAVKRTGAPWVGIWASVNDIALQAKFVGKEIAWILRAVRNAVDTAKQLGLQVRFTVEDASRTSWDRLALLAHTARDAGADRISLADTVGILTPPRCIELVRRAVAEFDCAVEIHCHNDLGLALGNTLAAIAAGVQVVDASVLGLGERAGITDLVQLAIVLQQCSGDTQFNLMMIPELTQAVIVASGYNPDELRPVIGRNAFTHTAAYHVKAVRRNPVAYEPYPPELVGRERHIEMARAPLRPPRLPVHMRISRPFLKESSELRYHRDGPGDRWVLLDTRVDDRATFYIMQRLIPRDAQSSASGHVDIHRHTCDSALVFLGDQPDRTGLTCEVQIAGEIQIVTSPATIFIPLGVEHCYRYLAGGGEVLNIVLAGDYNRSLGGTRAYANPADGAIEPELSGDVSKEVLREDLIGS
jgi:isopropylmalate/homocitrate/citramalate synthase